MSRHDDLTALTYGEPPRADHPAYLKIYDLAAEYDIPVLIHHNIGPAYTDDPLYLEEMKNALAHNRNTVIIWAHTGISRRVVQTMHMQVVEAMLQENPNLYYDISWVVYEDYIRTSEESMKAWAELLMKYPDRFMIGSDKVGHWDGYEGEIRKYYSLVDLLDEETRLKVTQTNILNLIHVDPETMQRVEEMKPAA
jgi:predicted TIM-barrel fold metal-dependent hydrolase